MRKDGDKSILLRELGQNHVVSMACKKAGISRATYYRWYESNADFRKEVDRARRIGRKNICDALEAKLISNASSGNHKSIAYFLSHNSKRYMPKQIRELYPKHPTHINPGETCPICRHSGPSEEEKKEVLQAFRNFGLIKDSAS